MSGRNNKKNRIYFAAVVVGAFTSIMTLLFLSAVMWLLKLSAGSSDTFGLLSLGAGALTSGIIAGKFMHRAGLLNGLKASFLFFAPIAVVTLITGGFDGSLLLGRFITTLICGAVGGVIGVNQRERI